MCRLQTNPLLIARCCSACARAMHGVSYPLIAESRMEIQISTTINPSNLHPSAPGSSPPRLPPCTLPRATGARHGLSTLALLSLVLHLVFLSLRPERTDGSRRYAAQQRRRCFSARCWERAAAVGHPCLWPPSQGNPKQLRRPGSGTQPGQEAFESQSGGTPLRRPRVRACCSRRKSGGSSRHLCQQRRRCFSARC